LQYGIEKKDGAATRAVRRQSIHKGHIIVDLLDQGLLIAADAHIMVVCVSETEEVFKIICGESSHFLELIDAEEEVQASAAASTASATALAASKDDSSSTFQNIRHLCMKKLHRDHQLQQQSYERRCI
jgi:hypothetical protein